MDIYQLKYVLALAKYKNFTVASESCYITQSSLSQQISKLEKELGVQLFNRTTRTIQITEAGEAFIQKATEILRDMDELGQTMSTYSGLLRGTINIGTITALEKIGFSNLVAEFYSTYPNLSLNIYQGKSISLLGQLENRNIDVAFLTQPPKNSYPHIKFNLLGIDEYALVISDKHPLAGKNVVDLAELKNDRFILHHPDQSVSSLCLHACNDAGFVPNIVCRVDSTPIALGLVRTGLGVAFLPTEDLDHSQLNGVRRVHLQKPIEKRIVMASLAKNKPSHLVSTFLQFAEKWIVNQKE